MARRLLPGALVVLLLLVAVPAAGAGTRVEYEATTADGTPVTFAPCRALTWRLNLNGAPEAERANVQAAFDRLAAATGFRFVAWPDTTVVPMRRANSAALSDADIVFAFATEGTGPGQTDIDLGSADGFDTLGVGGLTATIGRYALGGSVVIDRTDLDRHSATALQRIYMHELAHAVGLGHVDGGANLMTAVFSDGDAAWGPDDVTGLTALGEAAGCLPAGATPPPLVTAPLPAGRGVALPPAPRGVRLDGRTFRWRPDTTAQTAFYTVRLARTRWVDGAWGPWRYRRGETAIVPGSGREQIALPAGWRATDRQAVAIVVRAFNQRGYRETTYRTR